MPRTYYSATALRYPCRRSCTQLMATVIACMIGMVVSSCNTMRHATASASMSQSQPQHFMAAISGWMYYDSISDIHRIRVDEVRQLDGRVKILRQYTQQEMDEGFSIATIRSDGQTIRRYGMDNPLIKTFEYLAGEGELGILTQTNDSAEFFIRVPLDDKPDNVQIRFKNNTLVTIPLKR